MAKILLAIYLIVGSFPLVPNPGVPQDPFESKNALLFEDVKETTKEPVKSKNTESDTEPPFCFHSGIKPLALRTLILKSSFEYLKPIQGYLNPAFAPPDFV